MEINEGLWSPSYIPSDALTPPVLDVYKFFGHLFGLALVSEEQIPLRLDRHVLKFLIGSPLKLHDLAFFKPQVRLGRLGRTIEMQCIPPLHSCV